MSPERVIPLPSRRATVRLGALLGARLVPGDVVFLEGELGAGKTFLTRAICRALGVPTAQPVQSPTFTLISELSGRVPIVHCDLYRLGDASELDALGLPELMEGAVTLIEWGLRFADEIAPGGLVLRLERPIGARARRVLVTARDARGEELAASIARGATQLATRGSGG